MRRTRASETDGTRPASEIDFILRAARRKSGPELMRHIAEAKAGPRTGKATAAKPGKHRKPAKRRKA